MIINNAHSVQEYWYIYHMSMAQISELMRNIILYPNTFSYFKNRYYNHKRKKETITALIIDPSKHVWLCTLSKKNGWIDQGNNNDVQSTDTINFILRSKVTNDHSVTYASVIYDYKTLKIEPYCVRPVLTS